MAMHTDVMLRETKQRGDEHTNTTDIYCVEKIGRRISLLLLFRRGIARKL